MGLLCVFCDSDVALQQSDDYCCYLYCRVAVVRLCSVARAVNVMMCTVGDTVLHCVKLAVVSLRSRFRGHLNHPGFYRGGPSVCHVVLCTVS
jgi:hypothetical protein